MSGPNCYACKHRASIPGDAHSRCFHPATKEGNGDAGLKAIAGMFSGMQVGAAATLNITADPHGIKNGWFLWPMNFDPVWLRTCLGFEAKAEAPKP